jgi:hypothetical protein
MKITKKKKIQSLFLGAMNDWVDDTKGFDNYINHIKSLIGNSLINKVNIYLLCTRFSDFSVEGNASKIKSLSQLLDIIEKSNSKDIETILANTYNNLISLESFFNGNRYLITEDFYPCGWYVYAYDKDGKNTHDYLQDSEIMAKECALDEFDVPLNSWKKMLNTT